MSKPTFEYKESLSLDKLRSALIRQEETIIFALIERAQFAANNIIYKSNPGEEFAVADGTEPIKGSFMEYFLLETDKVHARVRRFALPRTHSHNPQHTHSSCNHHATITQSSRNHHAIFTQSSRNHHTHAITITSRNHLAIRMQSILTILKVHKSRRTCILS
jgi:hypothetical protein